jgi:hypothetical protein
VASAAARSAVAATAGGGGAARALRERLQAVAQGVQALDPPAERLHPTVERLEEQLRAGGGEGGGDAVARVDEGLHALRVANERSREVPQAPVELVETGQVPVQELDEGGVEPRLPLEGGSGGVPRPPSEGPSEASARGPLGGGPEGVERLQPLPHLGPRLRGQGEAGEAVDRGQHLRVGLLLVLEPVVEAPEGGGLFLRRHPRPATSRRRGPRGRRARCRPGRGPRYRSLPRRG